MAAELDKHFFIFIYGFTFVDNDEQGDFFSIDPFYETQIFSRRANCSVNNYKRDIGFVEDLICFLNAQAAQNAFIVDARSTMIITGPSGSSSIAL